MAKKTISPCCDMRGMLSFLILFLLSKEPLHGQALADEIEKRKGEKPSPGTIYPALKALKETGWIEERAEKDGRVNNKMAGKEGKTIVYSLTPDGRLALKAAKQRFCQIFIGVME